jgi:hypothetical protein
MGFEFYIFPVLFWVAAAIIGVGVIVAFALLIHAVYDLMCFDCKIGKYKEKSDD